MSRSEWEKYREKIKLDPTKPRAIFPGMPEVIESREALQQALPRMHSAKVLGFDTESRPSFKKGEKYGVALVQFATSAEAWLLRVCKMGFPPELVDLIQDPHVHKVGVSLRDDFGRLSKLASFTPAGFIDLQPLAKAVGLEEQSVRKLSQRILGLQVSKSAQLSNWEADVLEPRQILYAATDAWVPLMLYRSEVFQEYLNGGGAPPLRSRESE